MKQLILLFLLCGNTAVRAQNATEIFLFDMKAEKGQVRLSNGVNITKHKGYDNQPFFHPSQPVIYYSSFDDSSRSDIKYFNYVTGKTVQQTVTPENEFSPTVTPDGNFISCILQRANGVQDLVKYSIGGGLPQVLIHHLKVGYHCWVANNKLMLFVLEDSTRNSLHYYYLDTNADTVIAENIGRSLQKLPSQQAMSFVQRISDKLGVIKRYDLLTGLLSNMIYTIPGQDQFTWLQNGIVLMSDGKGIFFHPYETSGELKDKTWKPVIVQGDASMLKGVTRLAANANHTKLAVVVAE